MRTSSLPFRLLATSTVLLLAVSACSRPEPAAPAEPAAGAAESQPASSAPAAPDAAPPAPATPAPGIPAPSEPSAAPQPTSGVDEPPLVSMKIAQPLNAKIGVPVDLRYQFAGDAVSSQPLALQLAAVPQGVSGELRISVQEDPGLTFSEGAVTLQKSAASSVYRKSVAVTRQASGPASIRVLVTMDFGDGASAFGFYEIPFESPPKSQKQHSVKLD